MRNLLFWGWAVDKTLLEWNHQNLSRSALLVLIHVNFDRKIQRLRFETVTFGQF